MGFHLICSSFNNSIQIPLHFIWHITYSRFQLLQTAKQLFYQRIITQKLTNLSRYRDR